MGFSDFSNILSGQDMHPPLPNIELRFHPKEETTIEDPETGVQGVGFVSHTGVYMYRGEPFTLNTVSFYYPFNLAIGCCGALFPTDKRLGYHPRDVERVSILTKDGSPRYVYFFAHSRGQGMWVKWEDCEKTNDGALVIYVAYRSHASYPRPKTYMRLFGFGNDCCSRRGPHLRPALIPVQGAAIAVDGPRISIDPLAPPLHSITSWERFFLALTHRHLLRRS